MAEVQQVGDDRSLGELFAELAREVTALVRQEAALAKTELSEKAGRIGVNLASLAAGGAVAYAGFLAILAAIIALLVEAAGLSWWGAALLVGIVVAIVGGVLVMKGISALKSANLTPRETLESLKEDAQWARKQTT
jgi:VIT1/CCC1 family predicted Fe2+/Mn2+ transporter